MHYKCYNLSRVFFFFFLSTVENEPFPRSLETLSDSLLSRLPAPTVTSETQNSLGEESRGLASWGVRKGGRASPSSSGGAQFYSSLWDPITWGVGPQRG